MANINLETLKVAKSVSLVHIVDIYMKEYETERQTLKKQKKKKHENNRESAGISVFFRKK